MGWNKEHEPINRQHLENPEPGDYWHEMFMPYVHIVAVKGDKLTVYRKTIDVDKNHWRWDESNPSTMTKAELRQLVTYETIPGFVADVVPARPHDKQHLTGGSNG